MRTNFHTHVYRCGHAIGDERVMVESAIKNKIEILGFSCHVPLPKYRLHLLRGLPYAFNSLKTVAVVFKTMITNGPAMRMPYPQMKIHLKNVKQLQNEYQNDIKIFQGFEAEYFETYLPYYQKLLDDKIVDYFILGHHFHKYSIHSLYFGKPKITDKELNLYKEEVLKALDTNLFSYIAHPDLFMIGKRVWDDNCEKAAKEICVKAKEKNVALELNGGGIRRGLRNINDELLYPFPNPYFWKIASEVGNKVVLGIDAHSPEDFNDDIYRQLHKLVDKYELNLVDTFEFKKGKSTNR